MKYIKIIGACALLAISSSLVGCNNKKSSSSAQSSSQGGGPIDNDSGLPTTITYLDEPGIQIHYQRDKESYKPWGLWMWSGKAAGAEYEFNYSDDYGVLAYYPVSQFGTNVSSVGFIVKQLFSYAGEGVWKKDVDQDRFMDLDILEKDEHDIYHIYIKNANSKIYTDPERTQQMDGVITCEFTDSSKIYAKSINSMDVVDILKNGSPVDGTDFNFTNNAKEVNVTLSSKADIADVYTAKFTFGSGLSVEKPISIRRLYDKDFDAKYNYDGDLGAIYSHEKTTFKVWSPVSQRIDLRVYDNGTPVSVDYVKGNDAYIEYKMEKDAKGVFSVDVLGDLHGYYYTYVVFNSSYPTGKEIVDPYAKSAGVNGLRGMIVDFDRTNPTGWKSVNYLAYDRLELAVYETHIAELTCSDTWNGTASKAKKYQGFYEAGTSYTKDGKTVKTGFDHIKELGVNAVQIIPFFDQANDEINTEFNWGYNPLNYNVVEGSYSSNPYDGLVRINELKSLVQAYNEAGITIIMDVVYNHVNGLSDCNFDVLMPFYYFRYTEDGQPSNGSGCGNETASDKYMYRKFMIDSVSFWTEEYKLGGFRFDLMGIHDVETMNQVAAAAKAINNNIVIYGEPWAGGNTAMPSGFTPATQANASKYVGYGQFNDIMRDEMIKSGMNTVGNKGWVTQDQYMTPNADIVKGIKGQTGNATSDPNKTVSYATCHDNYTLHDRCVVAGITDEALIEKMNTLANSIVFTSQGTCFMLAGEEMLRTKVIYNADGTPKEAVDEDGNPLGRPEVTGNSYSSPYKTNELNYEWKMNHPELFERYQKLIALKKSLSGLHGTNPNTVETLNGKQIIHVTVNDGTQTYEIYHTNGVTKGDDINANFTVNVEGYNVYLDTLGRSVSGSTHHLQPFETLILYK